MAADNYPAKSAYHGQVASRYDEDRVVEPLWAVEQDFVRAWVETLPAGTRLLDVPVGTGRFVDFYLARGLTVQARDISADMVAQTRARHPAATGQLDLAVGDAERLDLPDGAVDRVISWRLFHLIPPAVIERVLREFRRVGRDEAVVQVLSVEPAGVVASAKRAVKNFLRPLWRKLRPPLPAAPATPWSHIGSFVHAERDLLNAFARTGWTVQRTATLGGTGDRVNRVYFLRPAAARTPPA